jgi:hypothetical protein
MSALNEPRQPNVVTAALAVVDALRDAGRRHAGVP